MRVHFMVLLGAALLASPALAQPDAEQAALVGAVQKAVVRALNFDQGDVQRLRGSRDDFTPEGWKEFMKHLEGWLDDKGAPIFTSSFVPSEGPTIVSQGDGVLQLTMTGTLRHLKQSVCGGPTATPCR
jgi:hypothetical protein